jgi:hypothetical protein
MLIILVKEITPRIDYTMDLVFNEVMGIPYAITEDAEEFRRSKSQKINYTKEKIPGCLSIPATDLLYESELAHQEIKTGQWKNLPTLFAHEKEEIPFDIFSAIFFLVSRYEEYLPFKSDTFNRFEADQSIAVKHNFLHIPVVDLWCQQLSKELNINKFGKFLKSSNYKFTLTVDIDHAWVFKHKGILQNFARLTRDLILFNFGEFRFKLNVLLNRIKDPGDSYKLLETIQNRLKQKIKFFILSGGNHKFDFNIPVDHKKTVQLIKWLDSFSDVGLHPSISSNSSYKQLVRENEDLSAVLGHSIHISRQHYLMLNLPETYRRLIRLGINEEHSMGYGSRTGFRAGIARPFYFYDLYEEKQTSLRVFPFQVMDRTLVSYLNYKPEEAIKEFKYYTDTISSVGGHFIALWHNTSLNETYEWRGWKKVFLEMIAMNEPK